MMDSKLFYRTVAETGVAEYVDRRSRFIGYCQPVKTEQEAVAVIQQRQKEFWDATHNVYAYTLREGQISRYSDDGEPSGTAGLPVLSVLQKEEITNCVIVVTRYFGGTLLGTGGLVHAYSHAAKLALEASKPVVMRLCDRLTLRCDYAAYGWVAPLIAEAGGIMEDTVYAEDVTLTFYLPKGQLDNLQKPLTERSAGRLKCSVAGEKWMMYHQ